MDFSKLKSFDWRSLQKYASPQAADDLNAFLEKMPQHAGNTMLIIAGTVWAVAGAVGLYTTVQIQKMTELRIELEEAEALLPIVPTIRDVRVNAGEVQNFVKRSEDIYRGIEMKASGANVNITAKSTAQFGQFREAIGHVQNGGSGWRVNVGSLCVGRECAGEPLSATLTINKVSVDKPT